MARAVADAFEARSLLDDAQLTAAVRRGLGEACSPERVAQTRTALRHLGYVWRPDTEPKWEAGIPASWITCKRTSPFDSDIPVRTHLSPDPPWPDGLSEAHVPGPAPAFMPASSTRPLVSCP